MLISADIETPSNVAEPVTPVVVIPAPVKPSVTEPEVLADGVIDEIVWNVLEPRTVALAAGPVITSVCALPDKSVPTTVKVLPLSSPPALTIDGRFPVRSTKADFVPIFTPDAAAFEEICVISLKILVLITVLPAVGPVIVSVWDVPLISVPVMVNVTDDKLFELL